MTQRGRPAIDFNAARAALLTERTRLLAEVYALDADELALSMAQRLEGGIAGDSADIASDLVEQQVYEALEQTVRQRLADIDTALGRLRSGTYGRCEECGGAIDPARLQAVPWARRCLACQRRAEHRAAATEVISERAEGATVGVGLAVPERCPRCQAAQFATELEVDEAGIPTGTVLVVCASCGRSMAELPQPEATQKEEPVVEPIPLLGVEEEPPTRPPRRRARKT